MVEIGIKTEWIEIMCWMLWSFTVLLSETTAEVNSPCGLCLTPGGTCLAVGVVLQELADSPKALSVVHPEHRAGCGYREQDWFVSAVH